jgi:hypothetical protein
MVHMQVTNEHGFHLQRSIPRSREPFQGTIAAVNKPWLAIHDEKIGGLRSLGIQDRSSLRTQRCPN